MVRPVAFRDDIAIIALAGVHLFWIPFLSVIGYMCKMHANYSNVAGVCIRADKIMSACFGRWHTKRTSDHGWDQQLPPKPFW